MIEEQRRKVGIAYYGFIGLIGLAALVGGIVTTAWAMAAFGVLCTFIGYTAMKAYWNHE